MLGFLFRRLTADRDRGTALFDTETAEARLPHWYIEGTVPDTIDGRFAVLATVMSLALIRLERFGDEGNALSVAVTERFIDVMESEHRELGLGDPTLGKTVRKLVGSLARRTGLWREALAGETDWNHAARASLYPTEVSTDALVHSARALELLWQRLQRTDASRLEKGKLQ
jgi:cytochrome b pre-mRNA-processing protein 3